MKTISVEIVEAARVLTAEWSELITSIRLELEPDKAEQLVDLVEATWPELAGQLRRACLRHEIVEAVYSVYDDDAGYPPEDDELSLDDVIEFRRRVAEVIKPLVGRFSECQECMGLGVKIGRLSDSIYFEKYVHPDEISWDVCACVGES